eukprot:CAMPEP_0119560596 /NCGR_PEP_ID=MMETSP1352-20130426/15373_1 /TAXON_ID=265584 /ORGANISM="Stauroneis constricta, Strain CCMP1120" /LENGTH=289 /DNA_ID=CAMNT_0007608615 /DNA_START=75 /DNA_END=941 /DNA_ORIENTATION=-
MASSTVVVAEERVSKVRVEGLALLKMVKHCHDVLPQMASGSLLGLSTNGGVLEVTHAFPNPESGGGKPDFDNSANEDFQLEMMRMLREVNVDNNYIGWYQSMNMGVFSTTSVLETQFSYQTDLSPNAVVLLYDPLQTSNGTVCIKAFRLSDACVSMKQDDVNAFVAPSDIFEEVPIEFTNPALVQAILHDWTPPVDVDLRRLDLSSHAYLEKQMESMCGWVDDLANEQHKFQAYTRQLAKADKKSKESWLSSEAPSRMESLLVSNQIQSYCEQMSTISGGGMAKLFLAN